MIKGPPPKFHGTRDNLLHARPRRFRHIGLGALLSTALTAGLVVATNQAGATVMPAGAPSNFTISPSSTDCATTDCSISFSATGNSGHELATIAYVVRQTATGWSYAAAQQPISGASPVGSTLNGIINVFNPSLTAVPQSTTYCMSMFAFVSPDLLGPSNTQCVLVQWPSANLSATIQAVAPQSIDWLSIVAAHCISGADCSSGATYQPAITSGATPGAQLSASISDSATLTGLPNGATGTITFTAYSDPACTRASFTSGAVPVNGNGMYPPAGSAVASFVPTASGQYYWIASYSGDPSTNALPVSGACGAPGEESMVTTSGSSPCTAPFASLLEAYSTTLLTETHQSIYRSADGTWKAKVELINQQPHAWVEFNTLDATPGSNLRPDRSKPVDLAWTKLGVVPPGSSIAYMFNCAATQTGFQVYSTIGPKGTIAFLLTQVLQFLDPDLVPKTWYKWVPPLLHDGQLTKAFASAVTDLRHLNIPATLNDMYDILTSFEPKITKVISQAGFKTTELDKLLGKNAVKVVTWLTVVASLTGVITDYAYDVITGTSDGYVTVTLTTHS
jgi:hypothetical protein